MRHKVAIPVALIVVALVAYGYWHVLTHGDLYVCIFDTSNHNQILPIQADLRFLDSAGKELAQVTIEGKYGV